MQETKPNDFNERGRSRDVPFPCISVHSRSDSSLFRGGRLRPTGHRPLNLRLVGWIAIIKRMATISEALALALEHHQAGRLQDAERMYRQILAAQPNEPEAIHLLGVIAYQEGRLEVAVECISRAIALRGTESAFHYNLANAFKAQSKLAEAVACYRRALELKPDFVAAHINLGNTLRGQGKLDEAAACFRRALASKPDLADAHSTSATRSARPGEAGRSDRLLPPGCWN